MFYIQKCDTLDSALQSKEEREREREVPADVSSDVGMEDMMQTAWSRVRKQRSETETETTRDCRSDGSEAQADQLHHSPCPGAHMMHTMQRQLEPLFRH